MCMFLLVRFVSGMRPENVVFVLRFNVPVYNFSVMLGRGHRFLDINQYSKEIMCLAQGHNTVPQIEIEPRTS